MRSLIYLISFFLIINIFNLNNNKFINKQLGFNYLPREEKVNQDYLYLGNNEFYFTNVISFINGKAKVCNEYLIIKNKEYAFYYYNLENVYVFNDDYVEKDDVIGYGNAAIIINIYYQHNLITFEEYLDEN